MPIKTIRQYKKWMPSGCFKVAYAKNDAIGVEGWIYSVERNGRIFNSFLQNKSGSVHAVPFAGKQVAWGRWLAKQVLRGTGFGKRHHVHHGDGNTLNDDPGNLYIVTASEHARAHQGSIVLNKKKTLAAVSARTFGKEEIVSGWTFALEAADKRRAAVKHTPFIPLIKSK